MMSREKDKKDKNTKIQKDKKTKRQRDKDTKRQRDKKTKDQKESLMLRRQGSFAHLQCFIIVS